MLRTHPQTPSHFKAHKACTAESQPFPQAYVCLAITFLQKIKNIKKILKSKKEKKSNVH
jgi:hypothetical protein